MDRAKLLICTVPCFVSMFTATHLCSAFYTVTFQPSRFELRIVLNKREQNSPLIIHVSLPVDEFACDFPPVFPSFFCAVKSGKQNKNIT